MKSFAYIKTKKLQILKTTYATFNVNILYLTTKICSI